MAQGNIAQFNAPTDTLDVNKAGQAAQEISSSGYMEGKLYKQAGADIKEGATNLGAAVEQHQYMTEVSQGAAAGAALFNNTTAAWNKLASQPGAGDNQDLQKSFFDNTLEPALQQYQDGFSTEQGQMWALKQVDQMRSHFYEKTSADMMNVQGEARLQDAKTTLNQYGATVARDPTSADAAMAQFSSYVTELRKTFGGTPEMSAKMDAFEHDGMNELAKVQVKAFADNGQPKVALGLLDSGAHDKNIPAPEQSELRKYIDTSVRMRQADQDHAYLQQKRIQEQKDEAFNNAVIDKIKPDPNTGAINIPTGLMSQVFATQGISGKAKIETMAAIDHAAKGTAFDDPTTVRGLYEGIGSGATTQQTVLNALSTGKITPQTYTEMNDIVKGTAGGKINAASFNASVAAIKQMTTGDNILPAALKDPKGEENYAKGLAAASKALQDGLAKGIPESELNDPANKNWIGNAAKQFTRPVVKQMSDLLEANLNNQAPTAQQKPGSLDAQTADDFKTGKLSGPEGLKELQARQKAGTVSLDKAKEIAVTYGYAKTGNKATNITVPRPE